MIVYLTKRRRRHGFSRGLRPQARAERNRRFAAALGAELKLARREP